MTFLEICKQVHRLIRPGPELPGTVPTTTVGQTGVLGEIVEWVIRAYQDIQSEESEWTFMVGRGSLALSAATRTYALSAMTNSVPTAGLAEQVLPFKQRDGGQYGKIYLTASGVAAEQLCVYIPYEDWRGYFDRGTRQSGQPRYFTTRQGGALLEFDPTPDDSYTFEIDFKYKPKLWTATSDGALDPVNYPLHDGASGRGLPVNYHPVIAWRAVKYYALTRQEASNLYQMADREEARLLEKMRREFVPSMGLDASAWDFG